MVELENPEVGILFSDGGFFCVEEALNKAFNTAVSLGEDGPRDAFLYEGSCVDGEVLEQFLTGVDALLTGPEIFRGSVRPGLA